MMSTTKSKNKGGTSSIPDVVSQALPKEVILEYEKAEKELIRGQIEEIRFRAYCKTELILPNESIQINYIPDSIAMDEMVYRLCGGSVYAHADTLCHGYIRAPNGCRIGVCGSAVTNSGKVTAIHDITSIVIRIPCRALPSCSRLTERFLSSGGGMLLISPPGIGKTTILKSMIRELSEKKAFRVAVVDTRGELAPTNYNYCRRADFLSGYPRSEGIETSIRVLNPQVIICDEIGNEQEAVSILAAQNCGVPIIASTHGESILKVINRPGIYPLHKSRIFESYVLLSRSKGNISCSFEVLNYDEVCGNV